MKKILLLQTIPGFGNSRIKSFIEQHNLIMDDEDYFYYLIKSYIDRPIDFYLDRVKKIESDCFKLGVEIVRPSANFSIIDSPLLLFCKGDQGLYNNYKKMAVIGTRSPSNIGLSYIKSYIGLLSFNKWVTVSGLAIGCDKFAHREALSTGGGTIAVLPGGYRPNTAPWLLERGLFISEYPPFTQVQKYRCIQRNRIITGISKGLFVIESKKGGGSEHSIRFAYRKDLPIIYGIGFKGINEYGAEKLYNKTQFDLYLEKCIE